MTEQDLLDGVADGEHDALSPHWLGMLETTLAVASGSYLAGYLYGQRERITNLIAATEAVQS